MSGFFRYLPLCCLFIGLGAPSLAAQTVTTTFSANFGGLAKLSISSNTVTFTDADPDTVPLIPASSGPLTVTVKARSTAGSTVRLTIFALDNLRSGLNTIPASNLTWTTTGAGFVAGTVTRFSAQTLGTWTGSGVNIGTQSYRFQNSWTYVPGTYTLLLFYTLSAP
jgi:hypothetical protein